MSHESISTSSRNLQVFLSVVIGAAFLEIGESDIDISVCFFIYIYLEENHSKKGSS
ncbi:hypothetical protein BRO54_0516 [Geobacillus proteiniphilus]|uniref:Uncharacterized protein n=1 Tax=Geobacillus proteiniphilus TaxID=860353 RepID=A0A1Q5T7X1_9BACL|nr:hypothetical protein BRO54_0516 [Geobacillus proteiniphilus]